MPYKNSSLVLVMQAGNITNVTKKTNARAVRNSLAIRKLFFIMTKKAINSERFGLDWGS